MKHLLYGFLVVLIAIFFVSLAKQPSYAAVDNSCAGSNSGGGCTSVDTAIGPITTTPSGIAGSIMTILMSLSGGVAILLVIAAGYQMITSQGNPEKVKEGRERLISAIVGLLFIIFSVAILQIIGIDILHIPGLSRQ